MNDLSFSKKASRTINRCLSLAFGVRLCRLPTPRGWLRLEDLKEISMKRRFVRIFDVGANVGQSAIEFAEMFPEASIDCFEPVRSTFDELRRRTAGFPKIRIHSFGFSATSGFFPIHVANDSVYSSLSVAPPSGSFTVESGTFKTIDSYLTEHDISGIDLLKIDTEGHDLQVLKGGSEALRANRVRVIQVECGVGSQNPRFEKLESFGRFLDPFGYRLMGLYDQRDWGGDYRIGFANALFLSER